MHKGEIFYLNITERFIVEKVAEARQKNKENTKWNGHRTVAEKSSVELNVAGFGAEFIFCREMNIFPDFEIKNTSKVKGTDLYDAIWKGYTIDVKVNRNPNNPLMIPEYAKSNCDLFVLFSCKYPKYRFEGFATNKMIFNKNNIRMTRVSAYVLEKIKLLSIKDLNI